MITEFTISNAACRQIAKELLNEFIDHERAIDINHQEMAVRAKECIVSTLAPEEIQSLLRTWALAPSAFVIRNATVIDQLPATPVTGFADDYKLADLDAALLGFLSLLGICPTAYAFENDGRMARNVIPNPDLAEADSSWGFGTTLAWHQDNNFQPFEFDRERGDGIPPMPRYLAFLGLRNSEQVPTQLLPLSAPLSKLPVDVHACLEQSYFSIAPPQSVRDAECNDQPSPILWSQESKVYSRFDTSEGVQGVNESAIAALAALRQAVSESSSESISALLAPGDILIFDNYRVMHRREGFRPHSKEAGRWLRRVYGLTAKQT